MKQIFFLLAMLLSFSAYSQLSETENRALDELIASEVEIEADALKSRVVASIFDAAFFLKCELFRITTIMVVLVKLF